MATMKDSGKGCEVRQLGKKRRELICQSHISHPQTLRKPKVWVDRSPPAPPPHPDIWPSLMSFLLSPEWVVEPSR